MIRGLIGLDVDSGLRDVIEGGLSDGVFPGCAFAWGGPDSVSIGVAGRYRYDESPCITTRTLFDVASLTKIMATTMASMLLESLGHLELDTPVSAWIPEYRRYTTQAITARHLLTHSSGLPAYPELWQEPDQPFWARVLAIEPDAVPGEHVLYSCLGFLVLQRLIEAVSGMELGPLVEREVFLSLGLAESRFAATWHDPLACAPTERIEPWRAQVLGLSESTFLQGIVHDPLAFLAGGYAGNAGVFAPITDVAKFAQRILCGVLGEAIGPFQPSQLQAWTKSQSPGLPGLGWDLKSPTESCLSAEWSSQSFGHLGYTGTSLYIDPVADKFAVLLTNRVHPTSENRKIVAFRPKFHAAVARLWS